MSELLSLLSEIVKSEYAQWMRYTYLSALGYGLGTDPLSEHFKEHASDELEHAERVSRWIVDLGGVPPTCMSPVEPFSGSTEDCISWLIDYEVSGIEKYNAAHQLCTGVPALQNDLAEILSTEHEHLSDLQKLVYPHTSQESLEDDFVVIVAKNKKAVSYREMIDWAKDVLAPYQEIQWYSPEDAKQVLLEAIEDDITAAWPKRDDKKVLDNLKLLKERYKLLSQWSDEEWSKFHEEFLTKETTSPDIIPKFENIMEQIEPISYEEEDEEPAPTPAAPAPAQPEQPAQEDEEDDDDWQLLQQTVSRPIDKEIEDIKPQKEGSDEFATVYAPGKRGKTTVRIGDKVYNSTGVKHWAGPTNPAGRKQRNKVNTGIIKQILASGDLVVEDLTGQQHTWKPSEQDIEKSLR